MNIKPTHFCLTVCFFWAIGTAHSQSVGINEDGASPDASAILDVSSTSKGFLTPRMTSTEREAISSPAEGLMVFDTDYSSLFYYSSNKWQKLEFTVSGDTGDDVPSNPYVGQFYFDTVDEKLFIYVSSGWSEVTLGTPESSPY